MRPPSPTPYPVGQSLGAQLGTTVQLATGGVGDVHPAESFPQCCFDRKIRCPEGVSPRAWAPRLLVSVGEIHLEKGAGDSCECKRQFRGWKTSLEITKCHILLVILIKIAQNILYKLKKKKKKERMSTMLYLGVRYLPSLFYRCGNQEVTDLLKLQLGNGLSWSLNPGLLTLRQRFSTLALLTFRP